MTVWEVASIPVWASVATLCIAGPIQCKTFEDFSYAVLGGALVSIPLAILGAWLCS